MHRTRIEYYMYVQRAALWCGYCICDLFTAILLTQVLSVVVGFAEEHWVCHVNHGKLTRVVHESYRHRMDESLQHRRYVMDYTSWLSYYISIYVLYIYEQGPPHPPPPPARWFPPPPCGRGGEVFSAAKPIVAGGNHGVCSLYSAYSAYVSIIRMDILYVI